MTWKTFKEELIAKKILSPVFSNSIDVSALEFLLIKENDQTEHEPLLLERHIESAIAVLDRMLAYRREFQELEILAVKATSDYLLYMQQSAIDLEIEKIRLRELTKSVSKSTQDAAAQAFGNASSIERGFKVLAEGTSKQIQQELNEIYKEKSLLDAKWGVIKSYQETYWSRHNEEGNAHNFGQRAENILHLVLDDLAELYDKALAISTGFEMIYGRKLNSLPDHKSTAFIDDMVLWCREAARSIEKQAEAEIEYDLIIPLVQPASPIKKSIITEQEFKKALDETKSGNKPFEISFSLPDIYFNDANVRLRRVGLSYGNGAKILESGTDRNATADSYARYRASIFTPIQINPVTAARYQRPPVRLGIVSVFGGAGPLAFSDGIECQNVSPFGSWRIVIDPHPVYKDSGKRNIADGIDTQVMLDLKLHLRVRTLPKDGFSK